MEFNTTQSIGKKKFAYVGLVLALVMGCIFLGWQYLAQKNEILKLQKKVVAAQTNAKVVDFLNLFIDKVLRSNTEVSFDDRLKLENAVRALNDPVILAKWEQFTNGTSVDQIQQGVKDLLQVLIKKITVVS